MNWPEKPTCHAGEPMYGLGEPVWREPRAENPPDDFRHATPFRTCSYCGSKDRDRGPAPATIGGKWYNQHLGDAGIDDKAFAHLTALLAKHAGIEFERPANDTIRYSAPYGGYQR